MISYMRLKNFKSFGDVTFDLRGTHGIPKKIAFIYGENGSGKTNLMQAFYFIGLSLMTLNNQEQMKDFDIDKILAQGHDDSKEPESAKQIDVLRDMYDVLKAIGPLKNSSITEIYKEYKSKFNIEGRMRIELGFYLQNKEGKYILEFDNDGLAVEELYYQINKRVGLYFSIDRDKIELSPSIFFNKSYRDELIVDLEKFWGRHTFLSIIMYELKTKNFKFLEERMHQHLFIALDWMNHVLVSCIKSDYQFGKRSMTRGLPKNLEQGKIASEDVHKLDLAEKVLTVLYTSLYSDIKGVYYQKEASDNRIRYKLFFKKQINGEVVDVSIDDESTGTKKILNIFPDLLACIMGRTVCIDEIDSGIHDLLMCDVFTSLEESLKGQFIATTHNTLLMRQLPPESVYIIKTDYRGCKEIVCVKEFDYKIQKNNNIQNLYLNGIYTGIPFTGNLDFDDIIEEMTTD